VLAVEPVEYETPVQVVELVPPVVVSVDGNISIVEATAEAFEEVMGTGEESGPPRCTGSLNVRALEIAGLTDGVSREALRENQKAPVAVGGEFESQPLGGVDVAVGPQRRCVGELDDRGRFERDDDTG
jgi:hypothetical protein